jgi:hypothetical protein
MLSLSKVEERREEPETMRSWKGTGALLLLVVGPALVGCTSFKRFMYEGWGRDGWQQPERVIRELTIRPGNSVADLGAGGGYFSQPAASI